VSVFRSSVWFLQTQKLKDGAHGGRGNTHEDAGTQRRNGPNSCLETKTRRQRVTKPQNVHHLDNGSPCALDILTGWKFPFPF